MSFKIYLGLSLIITSMLLVMYAGYNLNELLFIQGKASSSDLPQYSIAVFNPILIGVLAAIDGSIICGLKRRSSLLFYALANIVYLFSSYKLFLELQEPLTSRLVFYRIFVFFMLAVVLFTLGVIVNYLPRSKKQNEHNKFYRDSFRSRLSNILYIRYTLIYYRRDKSIANRW